MITISVKADIEAARRKLDAVQRRQLPFAVSKALNETAYQVAAAEKREMRDVFDRPTPATLNAVRYRKSTKANLQAEVYIADFLGKGNAPSRWLEAQVRGGLRRMKRFERALEAVGAMPRGFRAVPGSAAILDAYGNISGAQIVQILSYFRAFPEAGYRANITAARKAALARGSRARRGVVYFSGRPGGGRLPDGIWMRTKTAWGWAIKPVLIFVPHAVYEAIYDFAYAGRLEAERVFPRAFNEALDYALRTAR